MKPGTTRDVWASLLPLGAALLALVVAARLEPMVFVSPREAALVAALLWAGMAGACHRPLRGAVTLGLGAVALPASLARWGDAPTALLAALVVVLAELALHLVRRQTHLPDERRDLLPRMLETAGRALLATLSAGLAWRWLVRFGALPAFAAAGAVYLLVWGGLEALDRKLRRPDSPVHWPLTVRPLVLDALGWTAGVPLALVGRPAGWGLTGALAVVVGLSLAEVVRNAFERDAAVNRARDFERLRRAAKRMSTPQQEMTAVAERIRSECAKVIAFHWLQLEAMAPGSELKSWWWGPGSEALAEGVPLPERFPPVLPGFHRRSSWQIVERQLLAHADGKLLGRLRLWCDPRRLEPGKVELLDRLLPQMTTAVERCLLDREAREDPLTGVAMRRILEPRLHEAHARCCEEGGSMAVLLCDLDHFKRINDTHGHPAGDAALVAVAAVLKSVCRTQDLVCRYGGEEFLVLMDGAGGEEALAAAERLRRAVEVLDFKVEAERVPLTLSCGVAAFPELHIKTGAELILFADEALYEAKRTGRNRCLLDVGQGRYLDPDGNLHRLAEAQQAPEAPEFA